MAAAHTTWAAVIGATLVPTIPVPRRPFSPLGMPIVGGLLLLAFALGVTVGGSRDAIGVTLEPAAATASGGEHEEARRSPSAARSAVERATVLIQTHDSAGSGFLVEGGMIVTAAHVLDGATVATLTYADGSRGEGAVVGVDTALDLAVIGTTAPAPPTATSLELATVDAAPATPVMVWGYPLEDAISASGFSRAPSVSAGVVSALRYRDGVAFIQLDAAISRGNSGGPVVTADGRVVGIVASYLTADGGNPEGVNFALDLVRHETQLDALLAQVGPASPTP